MNSILLASCMIIGAMAYTGILAGRLAPLPIVALPIAALLYGTAWIVQRHPRAVNVPSQAAYDALPEDNQRQVVACALPFFYWSATLWMVFFIIVFGFSRTEATIAAAVVAHIAEGVLAIRFLFLGTSRKVGELQRAAQDESG